MVLVNGDYLHCMDIKQLLSESKKKAKKKPTKKKNLHTHTRGPRWPWIAHLNF